MRYENESLGAAFDIADKFTVREQLAFRSRIAEAAGESAFVRYWQAALTVVTNWTCAALPDPAALDLDNESDGRLADLVQWTANTVAGHMQGLETPGKNS